MPIVVDLLVRRKEQKVIGDAGVLDLIIGDRVVVEIDQAQEVGVVISKERMVEKVKGEIYKILRKLSQDDILRLEENKEKNISATKVVMQKIEEYELNMKLTCVEYSLDRTKLFIYYTADTRIDFRKLVKELGHVLKTRIQMVQIGVRDEAKMLGGIGPCGRIFCCKSFLRDFTSVTIDMVRIQDPSMNIGKLSGVCGRLMCCIAYEDAFYSEQEKKMPKVGSRIHTPEGTGTVISVHYIKEEITVELADKQIRKFNLQELKL
ncbi:MAG: stage 0 sporulation family protein [Endomicrobiia bacterium]